MDYEYAQQYHGMQDHARYSLEANRIVNEGYTMKKIEDLNQENHLDHCRIFLERRWKSNRDRKISPKISSLISNGRFSTLSDTPVHFMSTI